MSINKNVCLYIIIFLILLNCYKINYPIYLNTETNLELNSQALSVLKLNYKFESTKYLFIFLYLNF